jgi:hypothetical protein
MPFEGLTPITFAQDVHEQSRPVVAITLCTRPYRSIVQRHPLVPGNSSSCELLSSVQRSYPSLPTSPSLRHTLKPPRKIRLFLIIHRQPQYEIHHHRTKQRNRQHRRAQPIIEPALPPHPYAPCAPMERKQRIRHRGHGNERKQPCANLSNLVAEVEQADGEPAEDDGEVEPREEGALVGEEDFGLDAGGERDALACGVC